jgi:hypothetical protein
MPTLQLAQGGSVAALGSRSGRGEIACLSQDGHTSLHPPAYRACESTKNRGCLDDSADRAQFRDRNAHEGPRRIRLR